jgi:hypothetical protein
MSTRLQLSFPYRQRFQAGRIGTTRMDGIRRPAKKTNPLEMRAVPIYAIPHIFPAVASGGIAQLNRAAALD